MPTHVFYHRTSNGSIGRLDSIISDRPRILGSYPHEQTLVGFPENVVFWADATGVSVGIAPILPPPD